MAVIGTRDEDRPGAELVPGYRLLARVGSGGAGEVWSAEAPGGLRVALKIVRLTGGLGRREVANIRILRAVRHPNLLAYFGAWQIRDRLIIGMELADGSLWDRLAEARRQGLAGIPLAELLDFVGEVARVVDFLNEPAHRLEGRSGVAIYHRDIKPQNVMLIGRGVKVADFGLSCLDDPTGASRSHCGLTFAYAAPETFRRQVSGSSDQYSLAVTYCQLRGGRLPFVGPPESVMMGHLFGDPDLSMLPAPERPIITRAMDKDPRARWPDCRALVEALTQCARAGAPDILPGAPTSPEPSPGSSGSVEIPPMPGEWEGSPSVLSSGWPGANSAVVESVYGLDGPVRVPSWAVEPEALSSPTIVMAARMESGRRAPISRLGLVAASILAAGLVAWSSSERVATRAAIPATASTSIPSQTPPIPPALADIADPAMTTTPSPTRHPVAPPTAPAPRPTPRDDWRRLVSVARPARALISARLAELAAWERPIRKASATARTWLASLSTPRPPSRPDVATASPPPAQPGPRASSSPGLLVERPDVLEIEAGRSASIPIRLNRAGHDEPMSVHFDGLPAGVTILDATIPAGEDRARLVIRARLDAPASTTQVAMAIRAGSARAEARLRVRVRANPALLNRTRGHTLLACGRFAEAAEAFTEAIKAGVADALVYNNRGLARAALNQLEPAIHDYTEAIRINPEDATIRYNRGAAFARRGDDLRALLDLDAAIRLDPGHVRAYEARARIYQKHGDMARAWADSGRASALARAIRPAGWSPAPQSQANPAAPSSPTH